MPGVAASDSTTATQIIARPNADRPVDHQAVRAPDHDPKFPTGHRPLAPTPRDARAGRLRTSTAVLPTIHLRRLTAAPDAHCCESRVPADTQAPTRCNNRAVAANR